MKLQFIKESSPRPPDYRKTRHALFDYIRNVECKRLINRVITAQQEQNFKSLVVMSQYPSEGKTLCISALAIGFLSLLHKRVLIMDTVSQSRDESFYCHGVVECQGEEATNGYKNGGCIDIITTRSLNPAPPQEHRTLPDGRAVRTSPPPAAYSDPEAPYDCADFAISPFVESVKKHYDLILLDTCAISDVSKDSFDPLILAQHADAAIIVTAPSSIEQEGLKNLTRDLKRFKVNVLGAVLNPGVEHAAH